MNTVLACREAVARQGAKRAARGPHLALARVLGPSRGGVAAGDATTNTLPTTCATCGQRAALARCGCGVVVRACHCAARTREAMYVRRGDGCDECRAPDRPTRRAIERARHAKGHAPR